MLCGGRGTMICYAQIFQALLSRWLPLYPFVCV